MTTHAQIEHLLDSHDCTFEHHPQLELNHIDLIASITNQSRFEPIDQPTVERYVAALQDGATFPSVLIRHIPGTGKQKAQLVALGGNHRIRAHIDAGRKTIDAYLVTCDDLTALELAYADNATHGLPPTDAERITHALTLVARGRTIADACRTVGISHAKVRRRISADETRQRVASTGHLETFDQLPESSRASLATVKDDRVLAKLVSTISEYRLTSGPPTSKLIADVNRQPDVASQMDYIAAFAAQLGHRGEGRRMGRPPENPYLQLLTALGTIRGLNPSDTIDRCTPSARAELHEKLRAGARHLMAIDQLLQADQPNLKAV